MGSITNAYEMYNTHANKIACGITTWSNKNAAVNALGGAYLEVTDLHTWSCGIKHQPLSFTKMSLQMKMMMLACQQFCRLANTCITRESFNYVMPAYMLDAVTLSQVSLQSMSWAGMNTWALAPICGPGKMLLQNLCELHCDNIIIGNEQHQQTWRVLGMNGFYLVRMRKSLHYCGCSSIP